MHPVIISWVGSLLPGQLPASPAEAGGEGGGVVRRLLGPYGALLAFSMLEFLQACLAGRWGGTSCLCTAGGGGPGGGLGYRSTLG